MIRTIYVGGAAPLVKGSASADCDGDGCGRVVWLAPSTLSERGLVQGPVYCLACAVRVLARAEKDRF